MVNVVIKIGFLASIFFSAYFSLAFSSPTIASSSSPPPPTVPTESSKPLPSLETVRNIDTVLSEKVQDVITKVPSLKNQSISAASHDRIITLEGSVDMQTQMDDAINAAKSVNGVKEVKSQLTIKGLKTQ